MRSYRYCLYVSYIKVTLNWCRSILSAADVDRPPSYVNQAPLVMLSDTFEILTSFHVFVIYNIMVRNVCMAWSRSAFSHTCRVLVKKKNQHSVPSSEGFLTKDLTTFFSSRSNVLKASIDTCTSTSHTPTLSLLIHSSMHGGSGENSNRSGRRNTFEKK